MKRMLLLAMVLGLFISTIFAFHPFAKANEAGPVAYWKFDEGTETTTLDSSGNGNTGILMNGPQWVDGVRGKALKFDGVDDYVSVPDSSSVDVGGNQMSVEYWMKLPMDWHPGMTEPMNIYTKGDAYVGSMTGSSGAHRFNLAYINPYPETNKNTWTANTWYHMADVYDGSYIRMYVNGVLDKAEAVTGQIPNTGLELEIAGDFSWPYYFNGTIDELAIHNYARTAKQIAADAQLRNIALSPCSGFASTTITGSGFSNNSKATITWDGTTIPSVPSSVITDTTGGFAALISVPTQITPGDHIVNATDESGNWATATFTVVNMTGPQGPTGLQGPPGSKGDKGDKGDTGLQGGIGSQGLKGDKGDTGPQGPEGSLGETQLVLIAFPTAASIIALCIAVAALLKRKA